MTFTGWTHKLLGALGVQATAPRVDFLNAWARAEGGGASFNPLNTTERVPGSSDFNRVGVQNFPDELAGLAATLLTLRLHHYDDIRRALAHPSLTARGIAAASTHGLNTWGTGASRVAALLR